MARIRVNRSVHAYRTEGPEGLDIVAVYVDILKPPTPEQVAAMQAAKCVMWREPMSLEQAEDLLLDLQEALGHD